MLARAHSFEGKEVSDEEFYKFFEEMGEVWSPSKNKSKTRSKTRNRNKKNKKNNKKKRI